MNPERNDVDITKLFHWNGEFTITDRYDNPVTKVYLRLVGDAELNRARVFAIRKSADLRKQLKTEDTDLRIAFITNIIDMGEKEDLIEPITSLAIRRISQEAMRDIRLPLPKEPRSTATLEEQEVYQREVDSYEERKTALLSRMTIERLEEYREELGKQTLEYLRKVYEREMINELCEREMIEKFRACCAFYGSYKDENFTQRQFESFEDFDNLPTEVKNQYIANYESLEINVDELKKLQEAMQ